MRAATATKQRHSQHQHAPSHVLPPPLCFPSLPPSLPPTRHARCLFPGAASHGSLVRATNPHEFECGGVRVLGSSGQVVDDMAKYCGLRDRWGWGWGWRGW